MGKDSGVSKDLRERRFAQKYHHTMKVQKYDGEIFNSDDVQFLALWQRRAECLDSFRRRHHYYQVCLDLFVWSYISSRREKTLKQGGTLPIPAKKASELLDFLTQKSPDETFTLDWGKFGVFNLSFEKRGLFGRTELRWKFTHTKEDWDNTLFLPSKERKEERKRMKLNETRFHFWFTNAESDKLIAYLNMILPYEFTL